MKRFVFSLTAFLLSALILPGAIFAADGSLLNFTTDAVINLEQEHGFEANQNDVIGEMALSYTRQNIPYFEEQQKNFAMQIGKDSEDISFSDARVDNLDFIKSIDKYMLYFYTPSYLPVDKNSIIEVGGIELTEDGWLTDNEPKYLVLLYQEDELWILGVMYCELSPDLNNEAFRVTWNNWLQYVLTTNEESGFNRRNNNKIVQYIDVPYESWYSEYVDVVSKAGLMIGVGENQFAPDEDITLAEVYTIAARVHAIYCNGSAEAADEYENNADKPWFYRYVKYCMDNGIMTGEPGDVTQPAFRIECVSLLSRALPEKELAEINAIADNAIPDLPLSQNTENVYRLYRAGVLTGMDEAGNFCPESKVRRSEVAAIVSRLIDLSLRRSVAGLTHTAEDMNTSLTAEEAGELLRVALTEAYENIYGTFVPLDSKPEEYVPDAEYLRWVISHLEVSEETEDGYTFPVIFPFFVDRYSGMICKIYNGLRTVVTVFDPQAPNALSFAG